MSSKVLNAPLGLLGGVEGIDFWLDGVEVEIGDWASCLGVDPERPLDLCRDEELVDRFRREREARTRVGEM